MGESKRRTPGTPKTGVDAKPGSPATRPVSKQPFERQGFDIPGATAIATEIAERYITEPGSADIRFQRDPAQYFRRNISVTGPISTAAEISFVDRWSKMPAETWIGLASAMPNPITQGIIPHSQPVAERTETGSAYTEPGYPALTYTGEDILLSRRGAPAGGVGDTGAKSGSPLVWSTGITPALREVSIRSAKTGQERTRASNRPAAGMRYVTGENATAGEAPAIGKTGLREQEDERLNYLSPVALEALRVMDTADASEKTPGRQGGKPGKSPRMLSVPNVGKRNDVHGSLYYHSREDQAVTDGGLPVNAGQQTRQTQAQQSRNAKPVEHKTTNVKKMDMTVTKPPGIRSAEEVMDPVQMNRLVNQVYEQLERKIFHERRRMGL